MREIAGACHVSASNLYNYFGSKEAILEVLVGKLYEEAVTLSKSNKTKQVSLNQGDYLDYFIAATDKLTSYIIKNKTLLFILFSQTKGSKYECFADEIVERYYEYEVWSVDKAFKESMDPTLRGPSHIMIKNICEMYIFLAKSYLVEDKSDEWVEKNLFVISGLGMYLKNRQIE